MVYLRRIAKKGHGTAYPYTTQVLAKLDTFSLLSPITVLCGNNGSGKTTLLKALASQMDAATVSGAVMKTSAFQGNDALALQFSLRPRRSFYFSAEDFITYIHWMEEEKSSAKAALKQVEQDYEGRDYARGLASMPHARTLYEIDKMYSGDLSKESHGEGFLDFFAARLIPGGLYILDEPEGALSFENQYALALMIQDGMSKGSQFLIATHSPILAAFPDADTYQITDGEIIPCPYDELENIRFLKLFLAEKDRMLRA